MSRAGAVNPAPPSRILDPLVSAPTTEPTGFRAALRQLVDQVPGVLGVVFCDEEGEAVDLCVASGSRAGSDDEYDLRVAGATWAIAVDLLRRNVEAKGPGATGLLVAMCGRYTYFVAPVGESYFLAIWARADVSLGKALHAAQQLVARLLLEV